LASSSAEDSQWRRFGADGSVTLTIHAQPGSKRTEVAGLHGGALRIRVASPPVEGKANEELRRFLAEAFGVPLRNVALARGETSRRKTLRIAAPTLRPDRVWSR
jgi:uncharacterized protein (TIGR00251 family)